MKEEIEAVFSTLIDSICIIYEDNRERKNKLLFFCGKLTDLGWSLSKYLIIFEQKSVIIYLIIFPKTQPVYKTSIHDELLSTEA